MYLELAQPAFIGPLIKEPFGPLTARKFFESGNLTFLTV